MADDPDAPAGAGPTDARALRLALIAALNLIGQAQRLLAAHAAPDGPDAPSTIGAMVALLDGEGYRQAILLAADAVAVAAGDPAAK